MLCLHFTTHCASNDWKMERAEQKAPGPGVLGHLGLLQQSGFCQLRLPPPRKPRTQMVICKYM